MAEETLWSIGEFSRRSGLTPKALRLYDDLGLLVPAEVDPHTGYRRYAVDQIERARLVATLRLVGMPLARIRGVLDLSRDAAASEVEAYWRQVEADTTSRREVVTSLVRQLRSEEHTMPDTTATLHAQIGVSHRQGVRSRQQDAVLTRPDLVAVADGFGDRDDLAAAALDAFAARGFEAAVEATEPGGDLTGTTLTAVQLDGATARITHVGDARVQLVRDDQIDVLTHDHTLVAALVESGQLTEDEARSHPHRNLINRALVGRPVVPDERVVDLQPGDRLVLTTDGVHAVVDPEILADLLLDEDSPQSVADAVGTAVEDAGSPDNHTVVVLDLT
ncbi:MAG: MerR family transcriptional regulator [Nocardioides sp.]|uniref:MerR family transcriptional regulator n=1 Tax=Nocardioides sp. TaxID=35761 RepID=UPI0039E38A33